MNHLPQLVTFAHVVQAGSFSRGAERLNVSASVASKHVTKLERRLGARLLHRSTRKLSLTEAGTAYYQHAARVLEELSQSEHAVQQLQAVPSGRLKISVLASFASAVLAPVLPEFLRRYPKVHLEIICSERMVDLAEEGYDLAVRITAQPAQNLVGRKLANLRFQVVASPAYLRRHGLPKTPGDLAEHRCLGYPTSLTPGSAWRFLRGKREVVAPIQSVLEVNSVETLRVLALAGEGVALLPTYSIRDDLRAGRLVPLLPAYRGFNDSSVFAVYLPSRYGSPKLRAFVDFLTDKISADPLLRGDS